MTKIYFSFAKFPFHQGIIVCIFLIYYTLFYQYNITAVNTGATAEQTQIL